MQHCTSNALFVLLLFCMFGSYMLFVAYVVTNSRHMRNLSREVTYLQANIRQLQEDYKSLRHNCFESGSSGIRGQENTAKTDSEEVAPGSETFDIPGFGQIVSKQIVTSQAKQKSLIDTSVPPKLFQYATPKQRVKRQSSNNKRKKLRRTKNDFIQFQGYPNELHLPDGVGIFTKWEMADWAHEGTRKRKKKSFSLNMTTGEVTIRSSGIYLMYAQIMMYGDVDQGFEVVSNGVTIATCSVSSLAEVNKSVPDKKRKAMTNSCSTIGIFQFEASNEIFIRQSTEGKTNRRVWLTNNQSYFGFVRLGDAVLANKMQKRKNGKT